MNENFSTTKRKTVDAGESISKAYYKELINGFANLETNTVSIFHIERSLIEKVLHLNEKVTGIRFMYGLRDVMNPNSSVLMLIPCTNNGDYDSATPLFSEKGYYDQSGASMSILETSEYLANFVKHMNNTDPTWNYREITRGTFYGINTINELLLQDDCAQIRFNMGFETRKNEKGIHPVLEAVNTNNENITGFFVENGTGCPPRCGFDIFEIKYQAIELNVMQIVREFRDNTLLTLENGAKYYEMYFFITPFVSSVLRTEGNQEFVNDFYNSRFLPFANLVKHGLHEEALEMLEETLDCLVQEYRTELV